MDHLFFFFYVSFGFCLLVKESFQVSLLIQYSHLYAWGKFMDRCPDRNGKQDHQSLFHAGMHFKVQPKLICGFSNSGLVKTRGCCHLGSHGR